MSKRILVVDDNHLVRETVSDVLRQNNFNVDVACGGEECLDKNISPRL